MRYQYAHLLVDYDEECIRPTLSLFAYFTLCIGFLKDHEQFTVVERQLLTYLIVSYYV